METIAFLGTGLMGAGLAEAAARRGDRVSAWNRTASKAQPLAAFGVRVARTVGEAVAGADRVHVMLSDDAAVDAVLAEAGEGLRGVLVVDHSTVLPAGVVARAARLAERGIGFLHAPVFMSPAMCRQATGVMLCAGPQAAFDKASTALSAMTGTVHYLGERPDLAAAEKLFGNAMIITITAGLADVFSLAASLGIDAPTAHGLFAKFNPTGVLSYRGGAMSKGDYQAAFELTMARKDVRLMLETAAAGDRQLPVLARIAERMDALLARGLGERDLGVLSIDAVPDKTAG